MSKTKKLFLRTKYSLEGLLHWVLCLLGKHSWYAYEDTAPSCLYCNENYYNE